MCFCIVEQWMSTLVRFLKIQFRAFGTPGLLNTFSNVLRIVIKSDFSFIYLFVSFLANISNEYFRQLKCRQKCKNLIYLKQIFYFNS